MKEESKRELLQLEQLNAHMFQVMGALKLLNFKVKSFVLKLQRVDEADEVQLHSLNQGFQAFSRDIDFFKQEYQLIADADLPMPMLNHFVQNVDRLFFKGSDPYTLVEMRCISVYMYRIADSAVTRPSFLDAPARYINKFGMLNRLSPKVCFTMEA